jgi:hypothetical protein
MGGLAIQKPPWDMSLWWSPAPNLRPCVVIGLERIYHGRAAGFRRHALVIVVDAGHGSIKTLVVTRSA